MIVVKSVYKDVGVLPMSENYDVGVLQMSEFRHCTRCLCSRGCPGFAGAHAGSPTGAMNDPHRHKVSLVFFSTVEPISLTPDSCMQRKGFPMLYERAATVLPTLYVCPVDNVLGGVLLIKCYLNGNTHNTIPYKYRIAVPLEASADSRPDSGTGSLLFEINIWMWRYGRTSPREFSVADAVVMRKQRVQESRAQGAATLETEPLCTAKQVAQAGHAE
jgi:hypothetical protein